MEQVREYSYHLNPSAVERAGLRSALDRLTVHMRERFAGGLRVNVDPSLKLDPKIASALLPHRPGGDRERRATFQLLRYRNRGKVHTYRGFDGSPRQWEGIRPGGYTGRRRGLGLLSMEHYAAQAGLDLVDCQR